MSFNIHGNVGVLEFTDGQYRVALGTSPRSEGIKIVVGLEATQSVLYFEIVPWSEFSHLIPYEDKMSEFFSERVSRILSNLSETKH